MLLQTTAECRIVLFYSSPHPYIDQCEYEWCCMSPANVISVQDGSVSHIRLTRSLSSAALLSAATPAVAESSVFASHRRPQAAQLLYFGRLPLWIPRRLEFRRHVEARRSFDAPKTSRVALLVRMIHCVLISLNTTLSKTPRSRLKGTVCRYKNRPLLLLS
jgi:hypothetical protein